MPDEPSRLTQDDRFRLSRAAGILLCSLAAAIGVFLALPTSRPYFTEAVIHSRWDAQLLSLKMMVDGKSVPQKVVPSARALAVRLAAGALVHHRPNSSQFAELGLEVSEKGSREEPDNAFWNQAQAAFLDSLGRKPDAAAQWEAAAAKPRWDDLQTELLLAPFKDQSGVPSYVYAMVKKMQSPVTTDLIKQSAKNLYAYSYVQNSQVLDFRYTTLVNGSLMRKGARDLNAMTAGIAISDSVLLPPDAVTPAGHHEMLIARLQLQEAVSTSKIQTSIAPSDIFRENDAEAALTSSTDPASEIESLGNAAGISSVLPGSFLAAVLTGFLPLVILAFYKWTIGIIPDRKWAAFAFVVLLALTSGFFVPLVPGLTLIFSGVFGCFSPRSVRSKLPKDLGPLFRFTMAGLGIAWTSVGAWLFVMNSFPGRQLLASPSGEPLYRAAGAWALLASGILVSGPLWAFAQRIPTWWVIRKATVLTALSACWCALILAAVLTPVCVYKSQTAGASLQKIASNEPVYYLIKNERP